MTGAGGVNPSTGMGGEPQQADAPTRLCRRREYCGDGVYYECRLPEGHDGDEYQQIGKHDYGFGVGRPVPPFGG